MTMSVGQLKGLATRKARAARRFSIAQEASDAGATRFEAAQAAGMTEAGLSALLYRETGSTAWPLQSTTLERSK